MESAKFIKGYNKVNPSETSNPPQTTTRRRKIIAISSAILLTLLVASLLAILIQDTSTESSDSSELTSNSAESLRAVCAVTRYPNSCFSSISPLNTPPVNDPLRFFNLSLHASIAEVSALKNFSATDPALKDCVELFDDSVSQLVKSAELIRVGPGPGEKVLTEMRVSDLLTWISAAMSDQETCVDSMEEMGSTAVGEFKVRVQRAREYMSNTLAILSNVKALYDKFGLEMP